MKAKNASPAKGDTAKLRHKDPKPQDIDKAADPKQVGQTGNMSQNTTNRRHQQQREER